MRRRSENAWIDVDIAVATGRALVPSLVDTVPSVFDTMITLSM